MSLWVVPNQYSSSNEERLKSCCRRLTGIGLIRVSYDMCYESRFELRYSDCEMKVGLSSKKWIKDLLAADGIFR